MARLTAPLLSLGASGTIGKALVFASWKGIDYARVHVIPANPKSAAQQEIRGVFSTLTEMWKRMPIAARNPFITAARGQPLTARNKHIQVNVAVLQDAVNLDDLVMSVSTGSSVPPAAVAPSEAPAGSITLDITPPTVPAGYTLRSYYAAAVQDGDPSPVLIRTTFYESVASPGVQIVIPVLPASVTFQWGCWIQYTRIADAVDFYSAAVRGTQAIA